MVYLQFSSFECFSSLLCQPHRFGSVQDDSQESVAVISKSGSKVEGESRISQHPSWERHVHGEIFNSQAIVVPNLKACPFLWMPHFFGDAAFHVWNILYLVSGFPLICALFGNSMVPLNNLMPVRSRSLHTAGAK